MVISHNPTSLGLTWQVVQQGLSLVTVNCYRYLQDRYAYLARLRKIRPYTFEVPQSLARGLAALYPGQTGLDPECSGNGVDGRFRTPAFQSECPLPGACAPILPGCTTGNELGRDSWVV